MASDRILSHPVGLALSEAKGGRLSFRDAFLFWLMASLGGWSVIVGLL